jgi:uncharacterized cysteine cluster protein YcgN (CxxCxxCC family)
MLAEMSADEWEQLCDGCGRCCMLKVQDEDTDEIYLTRLACKLLDVGTCRCTNYQDRQAHVPDCITLTLAKLDELVWLPDTCAYRRLHEGRGLAWWHPLVSGSSETVHAAGVSVRGRALPETDKRRMHVEDFLIDDWPAPDDEQPVAAAQDGGPV